MGRSTPAEIQKQVDSILPGQTKTIVPFSNDWYGTSGGTNGGTTGGSTTGNVSQDIATTVTAWDHIAGFFTGKSPAQVVEEKTKVTQQPAKIDASNNASALAVAPKVVESKTTIPAGTNNGGVTKKNQTSGTGGGTPKVGGIDYKSDKRFTKPNS